MDVLCWSAPSVAENLALDVELAKSAWASGRRLVRFWWGDGPAVVMGSSERPEDVVNASACEALGVAALKRCSGGGTVLQTSGVLNYSLITPAPGDLNVGASFRHGTNLICANLARFGVTGVPQGTSDVTVGNRKISGNAQARRWKALLVHGTLLVDFDFDLAERILLHPPREPEYRRGRNHRDFLVTLQESGIRASRAEMEQAAVHAAEQVFGSVKPQCTPAFSYPSSAALPSFIDDPSAVETYRHLHSDKHPCS